jgi:hypothetical protein
MVRLAPIGSRTRLVITSARSRQAVACASESHRLAQAEATKEGFGLGINQAFEQFLHTALNWLWRWCPGIHGQAGSHGDLRPGRSRAFATTAHGLDRLASPDSAGALDASGSSGPDGPFPDSIMGDTECPGKELDWMPRQTLHG